METLAEMGMVKCESCGVETDDWYVADNNGAGTEMNYCPDCEERRSDRYGCALIVAEGAMCQDGACGCDGTGTY